MDYVFQPIPTYQQRSLVQSSLKTTSPFTPQERPRFMPDTAQRCDVREAGGGTADVVFNDCDGNEVARLKFKNGMYQGSEEVTIETGCDDSSSN